MKRSDKQGRRSASKAPDRLSELLQQGLRAYALSAGAAGVAVLACSVASDASPVCKQSSVVVSGTFPLNPAGQQVAPFDIAGTFNNVSSLTCCFWNRGFLTPNSPGAGALVGTNGFLAALASGASIGPGGQFGEGREYGLLFSYGPLGHGNKKHHRGNFDFSQINNFGFKFSISGETHYGWVRLKVTFGPGFDGIATSIHVLEYAYETTPNTPIPAGSCTAASENKADGSAKSSSKAPAVALAENDAQPSSLGMLALGAQGIPLWRR
jgi:hypothetical protein